MILVFLCFTGFNHVWLLTRLLLVILNHVETGVTAVYDRHGYDLEKRAALDFWGKRLDQIVSGKRSKVLAFVARG
jgi:hypothetical protein